MNNLVPHLKAIRSTIAKGWTQHSSAKDSCGAALHPSSPYARQWCLLGAVWREIGPHPRVRDQLLELLEFHESCEVIYWNDAEERTQEEVLERIDNAISRCGDVNETV